jgi:hypothetical protein
MVMALRASQGHFMLVFPNQNYGGALLTWIEGALIAVFGFHMTLFWVVDTVLVVFGAVLLRAVALNFIKPMAAAAAGGLLLFFSPVWVKFSSQEMMFYVPGIVLSLLAAWFVLRWFRSRAVWMAAGFGLSAGLALWCDPMMASLLIPPGVALLWGARSRLAHLGAAAAGFLVGVAPWAAVFIIHGKQALHSLGTGQSHGIVFKDSVTILVPVALGLGHTTGTWELIGWSIYAGSAACFVIFALLRRFELTGCAACVVIWPFVISLARVPVVPSSYRYALLMVPPLLILVCHLGSLLRLSVILALAVFASTADTISRQTDRFTASPVCSSGYREVEDYLVAHGRTALWGSYWIASPLAVCEYPHLAVGVAAEKGDAQWAHTAAAAPQSTYVVGAGRALVYEIGTWAATHDRHAARTKMAGFAVWSLTVRELPKTMDLRGSS